MSFIFRRTTGHRLGIYLVCLLLVLISAATAFAQAGPRRTMRQPSTLPAGHSSVRGRVVYKDNSEPLKGVGLRIFSAGDDSELVVFTNDRGEFRIDNVAAGKYYAILEGPGVAMRSGMGMRLPVPISAIPRREDFEPVVPRHDAEFSVDGTTSLDIEIRVDRGGKLSGKVLKPNGSPAANVGVTLISRADPGPYTSRFSTRTDKDGMYRFENLPAGDYVVSAAMENPQASTDVRARLRGESQIVTYHPAATSLRDASTIHLDSGGQVPGVNITLVSRQMFSVSGRVVRQQDETPLVGATVLLRNKESELGGALVPGMGQRTTRTDEEGRWSFSNVSEGSYSVTALAPVARAGDDGRDAADGEQAYRQSRQRFLTAQQDLIIAGNLSELLLSIIGPGTIRGTVELQNGQALPSDLQLFLEFVREGGRPGPPMPVRVQPDGSFSLDEIQGGDVYLYAAAMSGKTSVFVRSVTVDGDDLTRKPLNVIEGATAGPVRVVISNESARVSGHIRTEQKSPLTDFIVLLVPSAPEKQRFRTTYFTSRVTAEGAYALTAPPGEYLLFARQRDQLPPIISTEFIQKALENSERIPLAAGDKKVIELRAP